MVLRSDIVCWVTERAVALNKPVPLMPESFSNGIIGERKPRGAKQATFKSGLPGKQEEEN